MSFELHRYQHQQGLKAASAIPPKTVVKLGSAQDTVLPVASNNDRPFGVTGASGAVGVAVAVYENENIVKAIAAASLGYGAEVGLASIGVASAVQGSALATTTLLGPIAGASGAAVWSVGVAEEPAAAGEVFAVLIKPRQLSGEA